jgi:dCMP deaminase
MGRKSWHDYFLDIAVAVSQRASCSRASVGAVFIRDNRILTTGYNGAPGGVNHCEHHNNSDLLNGHCYIAIHAEMNAILQAATVGISLQDSMLYCTHEPCLNCTKAIIQVGCKDIMYLHKKEDVLARVLRLKVYGYC